jgi:hypothetical protein
MIILSSTSDLVRVVTGSSGTVEVQASWADNASNAISPDRTNTAISTATTTTVVGSPGSSTQRKIKYLSVRNDHATTSNAIEIFHTDGSNPVSLWKGTLLAQEQIVYNENTGWQYFAATGAIKQGAQPVTRAYFAPAQAIGSARVYMTNTGITVPSMTVGTVLRWMLSFSKTGAGVVAPILELLVGANGTTADTARFVTATTVWTQAMLAQTANADRATLEVECYCVGAGASGSLWGWFRLNHMLAITGVSTGGSQSQGGITGSIDLSAASNIYGLVVTAGTSAAWTLEAVRTEIWTPQ